MKCSGTAARVGAAVITAVAVVVSPVVVMPWPAVTGDRSVPLSAQSAAAAMAASVSACVMYCVCGSSAVSWPMSVYSRSASACVRNSASSAVVRSAHG